MENQVRDVIIAVFLGGNASYPLAASTDLLQAGIADSLGLMQLALELEHRFPNVRIDDQDITPANLGSIERITKFLAARSAS